MGKADKSYEAGGYACVPYLAMVPCMFFVFVPVPPPHPCTLMPFSFIILFPRLSGSLVTHKPSPKTPAVPRFNAREGGCSQLDQRGVGGRERGVAPSEQTHERRRARIYFFILLL